MPSAMRPAGREDGWYRGDCHVHSVSSNGGELTPERLADEARAAGLDFLAATEHNNADTYGAWGRCAGLDEVRRGGGLCVVAHPHAPYDSGTFMYPYRRVRRGGGVEVRAGGGR